MNIKVDLMAKEAAHVSDLLKEADEAVADAIVAVAKLQFLGLAAARVVGAQAGLIGEVLDYAGRANADVSHAALMLQGVHASLHEALERLSPTEERSGPGDKTPPPKP
jgi:hypothetical protein